MGLKGSFHSNAVRDLSYSKRRIQSTVAFSNDYALKGLQSITGALAHDYPNRHGIAGMKVRYGISNLLIFELLDDLIVSQCFSPIPWVRPTSCQFGAEP